MVSYLKKNNRRIDDLGIFFSYDPFVVDKASVDLLIQKEKKDIIKDVHPKVDYNYQFIYAEEIELGSTNYKLIEL